LAFLAKGQKERNRTETTTTCFFTLADFLTTTAFYEGALRHHQQSLKYRRKKSPKLHEMGTVGESIMSDLGESVDKVFYR